ncbi:MAG: diadenylate cyclase [Verrucomicrobiota bacterium]|nr:diadenylate cyclase [Verrucomicrobiota bacterium]
MRIDRYIAKNRVIDLKSTNFKSALSELLDVCDLSSERSLNKKRLHSELIFREKQMTTYLGNGVCLPHARVKMQRSYMIAVGRCPNGLEYDGQEEYNNIRYVFLLLAANNARNYLYSLASLARVFQNVSQMQRLELSGSLKEFRDTLKTVFGGEGGQLPLRHNRFNNLILKEAAKIAQGSNCTSVLIFGDTFGGGIELGNTFKNFKTVLIAQGTSDGLIGRNNIAATLPLRAFSNNRFSQLRSAVLIGLTRGIFSSKDRICCVGGLPQSNQFDSITVVDVEREFHTMLFRKSEMLPSAVEPEVIERVLAIATELAVEGREGRPIGCLFVLGDAELISKYTKPLILNPFHGYKDEDRNILNPFMDETVKELSYIDGAFIIRGDGALVSAGSLIHAPDYNLDLPSGLGSRHAAAAAITQAVDCLCIVVSGSSSQVTLFRQGEMLPLIEKTLLKK